MALVIIADQSPAERQRLRAIVEADDHVIVEADSGAYCLEIAEYHQPQCVLLSEHLPSIDTLQLLQALHQVGVSAIVLTTGGHPGEPPWDQTLGVGAVLAPDAPQNAILDALRQALSRGNGASTEAVLASETSARVSPPPEPALADSAIAVSSPANSAVNPTINSGTTAAQILSIDQLQHLAHLGMNEASTTLTDLTGCPLNFQPPSIVTMEAGSLFFLLKGQFGSQRVCAVQLPFAGRLIGTAQLFFNQDSASSLVVTLIGEDPSSPDFQLAKEETLTEVGNIVLNSVLGSMSNAMTQRLSFDVPIYSETDISELVAALSEDFNAAILVAQSMFQIPEFNVEGDIILFFKVRLFFDLGADVEA